MEFLTDENDWLFENLCTQTTGNDINRYNISCNHSILNDGEDKLFEAINTQPGW